MSDSTSFTAEDAEQILHLLAEQSFHTDHTQARVKICDFLAKYQEQPELLDPHIEHILMATMPTVRAKISEDFFNKDGISADDLTMVHDLFKIVYTLCKVRGYKTVVKFFPHEVKDLEPTWYFLMKQNEQEFSTWESRYCLFLWMSIIILIPFNLSTVDSADQKKEESLVSRMVKKATSFLGSTGPSREGSAVFLATLFSRPDMVLNHKFLLTEFFNWAVMELSNIDDDKKVFLQTGILYAISCIFKKVSRDVLLDYIPLLAQLFIYKEDFYQADVDEYGNITNDNILMRKLKIKILQRLGLSLLKLKVAKWRYERGFRSLEKNLQMTTDNNDNNNNDSNDNKNDNDDNNDDDYELSEEHESHIEGVIQHLLEGLRDKDTIVRWSAAKGVGRITMRLPSDQGDDVVNCVLELFDDNESDGAWHGGCLALAELARRGLLLPERLERVVPLCIEALLYDVRIGSHSVGNHVRDAACYVCWAFSRAYLPQVMQPFVTQLATNLLTLALFDREVNVRRAASAAFQENVGRQAIFPHGIEINTAADYFALGNRTNSYLSISVYVAQFDEYRVALIDHLVQFKSRHWEENIRILTSQALSLLAGVKDASEYIIDCILPQLVTDVMSLELEQRHGSCLCIAELVLKFKELNIELPRPLENSIMDTIRAMEEVGMFNGAGEQLMRLAACRLIECLALSKIHIGFDEHKSNFQACINSSLQHANESVREAASKALYALCRDVYREYSEKLQEYVIDIYINDLLNSQVLEVTRGYALGLGSLCPVLLNGCKNVNMTSKSTSVCLDRIVCSLLVSCIISKQLDTQTRQNSLKSLCSLSYTMMEVGPLSECTVSLMNMDTKYRCLFIPKDERKDNDDNNYVYPLYKVVIEALLLSLNDYSTDKRGDVGSWVRITAMEGIKEYIFLTSNKIKNASLKLTKDTITRLINGIIQQLLEKINKMRSVAGSILQEIIENTDVNCDIPFRNEINNMIILFKERAQQASIDSGLEHKHAKPTDEIYDDDDNAKISTVHNIDWSSCLLLEDMIPTFLSMKIYRLSALYGCIISVGDLTESIVKSAGIGLINFISKEDDDDNDDNNDYVSLLFIDLLHLLETNKGNSRIVVPLFKTFDYLMTSGSFDLLDDDDLINYGNTLHDLVKLEITGSKDIVKILSSINVFVNLVVFPKETADKAMHTLLLFLLHRYPKARRVTADAIYRGFLVEVDSFDIGDDKVNQLKTILTKTSWDQSITQSTRDKRNEMYALLGLEAPASAFKKTKVTKSTFKSSFTGGYADLVNEMAY